jgi:hypothetical protein
MSFLDKFRLKQIAKMELELEYLFENDWVNIKFDCAENLFVTVTIKALKVFTTH